MKIHGKKFLSVLLAISIIMSLGSMLGMPLSAETGYTVTHPACMDTNSDSYITVTSADGKGIAENLIYGKTPCETKQLSDSGVLTDAWYNNALFTDGKVKHADLGNPHFAYLDSEGNTQYCNGYNPDAIGSYEVPASENLERYLTIAYDLGVSSEINEVWVVSCSQADWKLAVYEVYVSNALSNLYDAGNKQVTYVNTDKTYFQKITFNTPVTGIYVGIKVIVGCVKTTDVTSGWNPSYARISEFAVFGTQDYSVNTDAISPSSTDNISATSSDGKTVDQNLIYGKTAELTGAVEGVDKVIYTDPANLALTDGKHNSDSDDSSYVINDIRFVKSYDSETDTYTYYNGYNPANFTYDEDNVDTYLNISYDLGMVYGLNEFWVVGRNGSINGSSVVRFAPGVYEIYASETKDNLYSEDSKVLTYIRRTVTEHAQRITLNNSVEARYVGIRVINGCSLNNSDWDAWKNSYTRISEIAVFGDEVPQPGLEMYDNLCNPDTIIDKKILISWGKPTMDNVLTDNDGYLTLNQYFTGKSGDVFYVYKNNQLVTQKQIYFIIYNEDRSYSRTEHWDNQNYSSALKGKEKFVLISVQADGGTKGNDVYSVFKNTGALSTMPETPYGFKPLSELSQVEPINPNANAKARSVLKTLDNMSNSSYKTVVGAFNLYGADTELAQNYEKISSTFNTPAMFSSCYRFNSSTNAFSYTTVNEQVIEKYNTGAIILLHNQNEWSNTICDQICGDADKTDFIKNFDETNNNRNEEAYNYYRNCREQWADGLQELKNAGVTVIFRPFVEMNNPYFYGFYTESDEGKQAFKNIWNQLKDYLFVERGLDNVLLAFSPSSSANGADTSGYFPGEENVDIVAPTAYSMPWVDRIDFYNVAWHYDEYASLAPSKPFGYAELGVDLTTDANDANYGKGDWSLIQDIKTGCPRMGFFNLWMQNCSPVADTSINAWQFMAQNNFVYLDDLLEN